jgi:hypothetical protein
VKSKAARRRATCIARLTCGQAVRRAAVATWALAAQVSVYSVRRTTITAAARFPPPNPPTHDCCEMPACLLCAVALIHVTWDPCATMRWPQNPYVRGPTKGRLSVPILMAFTPR